MRYSRHLAITLCVVVLGLLVPAARTPEASAAVSATVTRQGRELFLAGNPYRFTGVNAYHLTTDWSINYGCGESTSSANLDAMFASLRPNSIVRVWAFERQAFNKYTRQIDFSTIDRVVNAAAARNQKVILTIGNHWGDCDGPAKDTSWYAGGYRSVPSWSEGSMPLSYWDWLQRIVPRYAGNPAVAMWEPLNEPEVACGSMSTLRTFFDTVGQEMHRLDPTHLVSSGVIGGNQCGLAGSDYAAVHQSPGIDVGTYHDYYSPDAAMPSGLATRIDQMATIGKPLFIGEAGIDAADGVTGCMTTVDRAARFRSKLDAQFGAGIVGYLPWLWSSGGVGQCINNFRGSDPRLALLHDYPLTTAIAPPTTASALTVVGVSAGQVVTGRIYVQAVPAPSVGTVSQVEFFVDGVSQWIEKVAPYYLGGDMGGAANGWDTAKLTDGSHVIEAAAASSSGMLRSSVTVVVQNAVSTGAFLQDTSVGASFSVEVEHFRANVPQGGHTWFRTTPGGASGSAAMESGPNSGALVLSGYATTSPRLDFGLSFVRAGTYYLWARGQGPTTSDNSFHAGIDGLPVGSAANINGFAPSWTWLSKTTSGPAATLTVTAPGLHTLNIWMREDGTVMDKLVLTSNPSYVPTQSGPAESTRQ